MHLRFWSVGADFITEAQKFFNARTVYTVPLRGIMKMFWQMYFDQKIFRYKMYVKNPHRSKARYKNSNNS